MGGVMRNLTIYFIFVAVLLFASCGGVGGTETGTTSVTNFDAKFGAAASKLIPEMNDSDVDASVSEAPLYLVYGTSDDWATYFGENTSYVITDIFGSEDEEPQVVTKIRVLIDSFESTMSQILEFDSEFSCAGESVALDEGDTIDVAFYGELDNGTSDDRYYDCVFADEGSGSGDGVISYESSTIYGQDSNGVIRVVDMQIVDMSDSLNENENYTDVRGNTTQFYSVISTVYAEDTSSSKGYLDLQYNQATLYVGVDETAGTGDDVYFKSRSRITGVVTLDADGNPDEGTGDFNITKYDRSINDDDSVWSTTTQTLGRGGYNADDYSIFSANTDMTALLPQSTDYFCLLSVENSLPTQAEDANCESLETAYAWGDATFPFTLSPAISATFEDKEPFESDDTDLIESDGGNFTIPTYETVAE